MNQHETWMHRAIDLARKGLGRTSPNPPVGAVVVRDGRVVGEGYHREAGGAHAEVEALRAAGSDAEGGTLYVTLEPCNHEGRTPPCTSAILEAGITEVHYALDDPNPDVAGGGRRRLSEADVQVFSGIAAEEAGEMARYWLEAVGRGKPYVLAKFAASLDGKIATHTGSSRWITGPEARAAGHALRAEVDAVLVGAGTAIADDPRLTVRLDSYDGPQPLRVVLDSTGRVPLDRSMYRDAGDRTLVATTGRMPDHHRRALEALGVLILVAAPPGGARVDLTLLLEQLFDRGLRSVLVEGGSEVLGSLLDQGLVDEIAVFLAPILVGGESAPSAIGGRGVDSPNLAARLLDPIARRIGTDFLIRGRVRRPSLSGASPIEALPSTNEAH